MFLRGRSADQLGRCHRSPVLAGRPGLLLRYLAIVGAAWVLNACAHEGGFDPSTARPCDFFSAEEQRQYGLEITINEVIGCAYVSKPMWHTDLTSVTVEYGQDTPSTIADRLHLSPTEDKSWDNSRVEYAGSVDVKGLTGRCILVAPMRSGDALIISIGTDTSDISWNIEPINDPCKYTQFAFQEKILKKFAE